MLRYNWDILADRFCRRCWHNLHSLWANYRRDHYDHLGGSVSYQHRGVGRLAGLPASGSRQHDLRNYVGALHNLPAEGRLGFDTKQVLWRLR